MKRLTSAITILLACSAFVGCTENSNKPGGNMGDRTEKVRIDYNTAISLMRLRELARNGEWEFLEHTENEGEMGLYHVTKQELKLMEVDGSVERVK